MGHEVGGEWGMRLMVGGDEVGGGWYVGMRVVHG